MTDVTIRAALARLAEQELLDVIGELRAPAEERPDLARGRGRGRRLAHQGGEAGAA